jgi:hypothetical protein
MRCGNSFGTENSMKKISVVLAVSLALGQTAGEADAATKKTGRSAYSAAQQKAYFEAALKWCRKEVGASVHYVQVTYTPRVMFHCHYY